MPWNNPNQTIKKRMEQAESYDNALSIFTPDLLDKIRDDYCKDEKNNVMKEVLESDRLWKFIWGAKHNGKTTTYCVIETIYKMLHNKNRISIYCRNFYKHIKNTLEPTFTQALLILKNIWGVDLTKNWEIRADGCYFYNGRDEIPQRVYFENFEKIQAFQGLAVENPAFYFFELVIDEIIEDPDNKTFKTEEQEEEFYKAQWDSIPMLLQATIYRNVPPDNENICIKITFNGFTTNHWVFSEFINTVQTGSDEELSEFEQYKYLMRDDPTAMEGQGFITVMLSVLFKNDKYITDKQQTYYKWLEKNNKRKWTITVLGWPYWIDPEAKAGFFMQKYLFNDDGTPRQFLWERNINDDIKAGLIEQIVDGCDVGYNDQTSWVRIALDIWGNEIVIAGIPEILNEKFKKQMKTQRNILTKANAEALIEYMKASDEQLQIYKDLHNTTITSKFQDRYTPMVACDNYLFVDWINNMAKEYEMVALQGARHDAHKSSITGSPEYFGIENRQIYHNKLYEKRKIWFTQEAMIVHEYLMQQFKQPNERIRDEKYNRKIYNLINALELAESLIYKDQQINQETTRQPKWYNATNEKNEI